MIKVVILFLLVGFLTWYIQNQKIFSYLFFTQKLKEMRNCGFCLGFWVSLILYPLFSIGLLDGWDTNSYLKIINIVVTCCFVSFVTQLIKIGYKSQYGITII